MMDGRALVLLLSATFAALSCVRPESTENFVKAADAEDGVYRFTLPLSDTLCRYDISFYTRTEGGSDASLELVAGWVSPSGATHVDTVYMAAGGPRGILAPYRTDVETFELGDWQLNVEVPEAPEGFLGLGVICKRKEYGTRQTP